MPANTSTIQIEVQVDGKGGIKVLRQIGDESDRTGKKGKKSFRLMSRSVGDFNKQINASRGLLLKLGAGISVAVLVSKLNDVTHVASDLHETLSKSEAIFDSQADIIREWAADSATALGMSTQAALEHTATLGNMFSQLGAGIDIAAQSSQQMVKLSADIASFHNVAGGATAVLDAMASSFRGEYDALQRYIPTINAAAVQEQALAMTHKTNAKELTNLEKALAAQAIMVRDAGAAVGDFERTSGGLANQERILAANIENVKAKIGDRLVPTVALWLQQSNAWIDDNDQIIDQIGEFAENILSLTGTLIKASGHVAEYFNVWVKTWQALGLASSGQISLNEALTDGAAAVERFNRANKRYAIGPETKGYDIYKPSKPGPSPRPTTVMPVGGDQTKKDLAALKDLEREIATAQEEFERAMIMGGGTGEIMAQQLRRGVADNLKAMEKEAEETFTILDNLSQRSAEAMEQNFSDFYFDIMSNKFNTLRDYANAVFDSIRRATADVMGQMTKEALFGGGSSGSSGWISSAASWLFGGARQYGGPVDPNKTYLVGERGPEIFYTGNQGGQVIPNHKIGGDTNINIPISIDQGSGRLASIMKHEVEETVKRVLREEMR